MVLAIAVIPARLEARRLPRKPLLRETGKYLIQHVYEQASQAEGLAAVVIATDSEEIVAACKGFGARAIMTSAAHPAGTDRVAEAARILAAEGFRFDAVVNVQGDEPELDPRHIEQLLPLLDAAPMATLAERISDEADFQRSQVVKVVLDEAGNALYFSRAPIPYAMSEDGPPALRHLGIYAYRADFLQETTKLAPTALESGERLEQLRVLSHGHRIRVGIVPGTGARGIDTPEDYRAFLERSRQA